MGMGIMPEHLTDTEKKVWACKELLPPPGNEVVAELLETISVLRGDLKKANAELESWLFDDSEALESVKRGLEQSARGETKSLGSFAKYAEEENNE